MELKFISNCGSSSFLANFMSKAYGLELLFRLESFALDAADNGIDDTYDAIVFNRPRKAAFSQFCAFLRDQESIVYQTSDLKKSKTVLRLSPGTLEELAKTRSIAAA